MPSITKMKKKKKKEKDKIKKILEQEVKAAGDSSCDSSGPSGSWKHSSTESKTKAELAFEKIREQRAVKEAMTKPPKSHKERIMDFNNYLDNLSEHYDIPKVSWTK